MDLRITPASQQQYVIAAVRYHLIDKRIQIQARSSFAHFFERVIFFFKKKK